MNQKRIQYNIIKQIRRLSPQKAEEVIAILKEIKRMKEEGKDECNAEMFCQVIKVAQMIEKEVEDK